MKKTDWEQVQVSMDLFDKIPKGEMLDGSASTLTIEDTFNQEVTSEMLVDVDIAPSVVYATIKGGTKGCTYNLRFKGKTTDGTQVEGREALLII